jgi:hypothetical protein
LTSACFDRQLWRCIDLYSHAPPGLEVEMVAILVILTVVVLLMAGLAAYAEFTTRGVEKAIPPRGQFIEIDGCRINYLDVGAGPAIVMIHGLGGQMLNFNYGLVDRLAEAFRVIVISRPGAGYSTRRSQFYLLGNAERVIHFDSEIADGALQLRVPQQKLHRPEVAGLSVNLRGLRSPHRMRAVR